jgi:hypothetical protein
VEQVLLRLSAVVGSLRSCCGGSKLSVVGCFFALLMLWGRWCFCCGAGFGSLTLCFGGSKLFVVLFYYGFVL